LKNTSSADACKKKMQLREKSFQVAGRTFLPLLLLSKRAWPLLVGPRKFDFAREQTSRRLWEPPARFAVPAARFACVKLAYTIFHTNSCLEDSPA
jgi:hypothetical protein